MKSTASNFEEIDSLMASTSHVWSMCLLLPYVAVDGKNPANQLRLIVYPIIYKVFYIPAGCLGFLNHQQYVSVKEAPGIALVHVKACA